MSHTNESRRLFFKTTLMAAASGLVLDALSGRAAEAQPKPELIDMTETKRKDATNKTCVQAAKSINYRDSAAELAKEIKSKKVKATPVSFKDKSGKEIPLENRTCAKCALFAMSNPSLHTCVLINGCLVKEAGSCTSWSPKPGAV